MKSIKFCILLAALCCMVPAMAQKKFGSVKYSHMCSYYGEEITGDITTYASGATAESVVKKIMSVIGLKPNFELREANVPNAAAVMVNGKRLILYNPTFMDQINSSTGTNWAAISILAHEIGHHLNGHTLDNVGSRPGTELDADEFSGFVLRKLGSSLPDAQAVMALISSPNGTKTHPAKRDRLTFIATGWNNAADGPAKTISAPAKQVASTPKKTVSAPVAKVNNSSVSKDINRTVAVNVPRTASVAKPSSIAAGSEVQQSINASASSDVYFTKDPSGHYYLTNKGNLVEVEGNKVYLVGKLYKSDKSGYKMMFADDNNNKIYVTTSGVLINHRSEKIGYMKSR